MRVLVVEDNRKMASLIASALVGEGMESERCHDGAEALELLRKSAWDVVVLDLMLPGLGGMELLQKIRAGGDTTPVLILTAKGEVEDRVTAFRSGADQFLTKPFSTEELVARVQVLGGRSRADFGSILRLGDLSLDPEKRTALRAGQGIELTEREFRLLEFLMRHSGRVCTRLMILEEVWDYHFDPGTNIVDVYIRKLREKIDPPPLPKMLHSVRGEGYLLKAADALQS